MDHIIAIFLCFALLVLILKSMGIGSRINAAGDDPERRLPLTKNLLLIDVAIVVCAFILACVHFANGNPIWGGAWTALTVFNFFDIVKTKTTVARLAREIESKKVGGK